MQIKKIGLIIVILTILYIPSWFIYSRFFLDIYELDGYILKNQDFVYVYKKQLFENDERSVGKPIGIAFHGKRTWLNTIFPYWIREYNNDQEHNEIFVKGLMDEGSIYEKVTK